MNPRDRILGAIRMHGSATYKQIAAPLNHRFDRDAIHDELKRMVDEGILEQTITQVTSWKSYPPFAGTRSRYRLAQGAEARLAHERRIAEEVRALDDVIDLSKAMGIPFDERGR